MLGEIVDGSSSKSNLGDDLDHKELSPLTDDKEVLKGFRGMPMSLTENFLRKGSSASSPKSPDKESTPSDKKLGFSVTGGCMPTSNQRPEGTSSSNDLDGIVNRSETDQVPSMKITMPSEERYELQRLRYGNRLDPRLGGMSSSNRANGLGRNTNDTIIDVEMPQNLKDMSSQLFNICKRGDNACFLEKINFLYEHEKNCLYDVLLLQNEKDQDTLLHVAIKGNNVDLVKGILHILDKPYNSDNSYECKYFKDKKENEKPLFKVVSTKNKERKSVITLVIEGNDLEHIAAVFEYLPSDGETKQLLIECCGKVNDACKVLEDNNKKSARAKWLLSKGQLIFALLAGCSFLTTVGRFIYNAANERTSLHHATIKHTSSYNYNTSSYNATIRYASSPRVTDDSIFQLTFSLTGLMIFLNYVSSKKLSRYKKKRLYP